jgi:hypothetical protein
MKTSKKILIFFKKYFLNFFQRTFKIPNIYNNCDLDRVNNYDFKVKNKSKNK